MRREEGVGGSAVVRARSGDGSGDRRRHGGEQARRDREVLKWVALGGVGEVAALEVLPWMGVDDVTRASGGGDAVNGCARHGGVFARRRVA
jgi:hypothetical protein